MAISKIKGGAINDDAISTAKIVDDAVTSDKIVDSYTTSVKTNPEFQGTEAARMPVGTTAERANAQSGDIRFNSTLALMEYYDGTIWKAIDAPPVVSSISPTTENEGSANIVITGSNFQSGATVQFIGNDGTVYNSPSVTVDSSTQVTATTPSTPLSVANEPYDIKLTNTSGLSGTLADALDAGGVPSWDTASGTIGTIYDGGRSSVSLSVSATDPDGDTITYAIASGDSLPSGLSLNTSTGAITGSTSAVGSDVTTTFDIEASTTSGDTVSRTFNIIQKAPTIQSFTSVGSGTFSVPSGLTAVDVLVVAGGGSGPKIHGGTVSGGGGAGGLIYRPAYPVTPGGSVSYTVGDGVLHPNYNAPSSIEYDPGPGGQNSVFGTLTAVGGGGGTGTNNNGQPGGSGGGGGAGGGGPGPGGTGTQPQASGDSGTYGFGNPGGASSNSSTWGGGGGGGAGGVGQSGTQTDPSQAGGDGGIGKQYDISGSQVYYAGGGGGNSSSPGTQGAGGQGGGGAGSWNGTAGSGTANRGGGGGSTTQAGVGSKGGSGIVIVAY